MVNNIDLALAVLKSGPIWAISLTQQLQHCIKEVLGFTIDLFTCNVGFWLIRANPSGSNVQQSRITKEKHVR